MGELELNVGRIIGDSPIQMQKLFENGLAGPSPGPDPRAVLASCDGPDLDFTGDEGVLDHVRAWGYSAASDMVDNLDWRGSDLLAALGDQFAIFAFADHANQTGIGTPPDPQKGGLLGSELTGAMDNADSAARRPFVGILGCRSGYSLVREQHARLLRRGKVSRVSSPTTARRGTPPRARSGTPRTS